MFHAEQKYDEVPDEESLDENTRPRQSTWSNFFSYRGSFIASLIVITGLVMFIFLGPSGDDTPWIESNRFFPHFRRQIISFRKYNEYEHSLAMAPGSPWPQLLPKGYGFVKIPDPRSYNVTGGMPLDVQQNTIMPERYLISGENPKDTEVYVISMFHQLHCLMMIRDTFMTTNEEGKVVAGMNLTEDISNGHLNHCFDYIRQAIMCAGDTALDRYQFDESSGTLEFGVNGWGTNHVCRDFSAIYEFAEKKGWMRSEHPMLMSSN